MNSHAVNCLDINRRVQNSILYLNLIILILALIVDFALMLLCFGNTCPPTIPLLNLRRSVCDQALFDQGTTDLRSALKLNSRSWLCTNLRMFQGRSLCLQKG